MPKPNCGASVRYCPPLREVRKEYVPGPGLYSGRFDACSGNLRFVPKPYRGGIVDVTKGLAKDEATLERYRLAEIKHSRLAMIAIGGFIHQYWVTKQTVLEQLNNFKSLS